MATEQQKTELLDDFQKYLEQSQAASFPTHNQPDLNTLLSELTVLKTEVKTESRQFKQTLETLSTALDMVKEENKRLVAELESSHQRLIEQHDKMMRTILLELIEIYDRLSASVDILQGYRSVNRLFKHSKKKDIRFIHRFKEGQLMTVSRFMQLLQHYQVEEIDCVGQRLDPTMMIAVEVEKDKAKDNGVVLAALRKGFLYQNKVLRLAEVKVNKL